MDWRRPAWEGLRVLRWQRQIWLLVSRHDISDSQLLVVCSLATSGVVLHPHPGKEIQSGKTCNSPIVLFYHLWMQSRLCMWRSLMRAFTHPIRMRSSKTIYAILLHARSLMSLAFLLFSTAVWLVHAFVQHFSCLPDLVFVVNGLARPDVPQNTTLRSRLFWRNNKK